MVAGEAVTVCGEARGWVCEGTLAKGQQRPSVGRRPGDDGWPDKGDIMADRTDISSVRSEMEAASG